MSVSMYSGQVARLEKDLAGLQKKAAGERERAAKERGAAAQKRRQITRNTSESQRLGKEKEAAACEEKAARHESKAADIDRQTSQKGGQLQGARTNLQRAETSERTKEERRRKQDLDREKRDLAEIERRRRSLQSTPPDFSPQEIPWRGEPVVPRGQPIAPRGGPLVPELSSAEDATTDGPQFDVCLSFAGEQRSYVELVARGLKARGYKIFYDADEQSELWGKNLAEHFEWVYRVASRACLMFISADYAAKPWSTHERRSALARALEEDEYVLPVRFDDTELPGLSPTVGYIDLAEVAPESLVELLAEKLGPPVGSED